MKITNLGDPLTSDLRVRFSVAQKVYLEELAELNNCSCSEIVRRIVDYYRILVDKKGSNHEN